MPIGTAFQRARSQATQARLRSLKLGLTGGGFPGSAPSLPGRRTSGLDIEGLVRAFGPAACDRVPSSLRPLCESTVRWLSGGGRREDSPSRDRPGGGGGFLGGILPDLPEGFEFPGTTPAPLPPPRTAPTPLVPMPTPSGPDCPRGTREIFGRCVGVPLGDAPGGNGASGGRAVVGSFNLPAIQPEVETRTHRSCPDGMVLGRDNLCYPKAILSRRSKFRKWRQPRRPMFTAGDLNAIRRAERLKGKAKKIGKDLGFKVTKK